MNTSEINELNKLSAVKLSLSNRLKQWFLSTAAYLLIRLLYASLRFEVADPRQRQLADQANDHQSFAIATWHEHCVAGILAHSWQSICLLVSQSFDGEMIAQVANHFGFPSIRGSSSRGGREALRQLIRVVRSGWRVAFTVDGPRGPRHEVKPGVISLARSTGVPILPMLAIADKSWIFPKSWDQFRLPRPFSKVRIYYGEPLFISKDASSEDMENCRVKLQMVLQSLQQQVVT